MLGLLAGDIAGGTAGVRQGHTIVLGFDGMDPELTEGWMADGTLPNFARLAREGHFQSLATTNPAQSPVAWASFATGLNPGEHGIFDFLRRNTETYAPEYGIAYVEEPEIVIRALGYQIPLDQGATRSRRVGTPFWFSAEREGHRSSVLRVPVTYPAEPIYRMLSGMGVPDLLGSQGTFTFYTTEAVNQETTGGRVITVEVQGDRVESALDGPPHPLYQTPVPLSIPLTIEKAGSDRVRIALGDHEIGLARKEWSEWVTAEFSFAGLLDVPGLVRFYLVEAFPELKLYVSPIQIDPREPVAPISTPADYAARLAERIGLYHTIGMPEETWSLNEERINDQAYIEMVRTILGEREAMLFDTLQRDDSDLVVAVFVQTDRVSHMFWRGSDPLHPLHRQTGSVARSAIKWIYGEADRVLGRVLQVMRPEDRLIVLSDHGFTSFRRAVHLNRWLADAGYLTLKPGKTSSESLFANVDWTRTKAFALGLNGIFLNLAGREALGIVPPQDAGAIKREIAEKLKQLLDPQNEDPVIATVYDGNQIYRGQRTADAPDLVIGYDRGYRASWQTALGGVPEALIEDNVQKWSGDHCVEPSLVPGILFTSFKPQQAVGSITDVPRLVRDTLGLDGTVDAADITPSSGLFNFGSPVLYSVDGLMSGWLPGFSRLMVWGLFTTVVSIGLYKLTSNHSRLAGRQLWLTLVPAVIASVPVIFIVVWVSNAFGSRPPQAAEQIEVNAIASEGHQLPPLHWQGDADVVEHGVGSWSITWPERSGPLELIDSDGTVLLALPTPAPVSTVHQRQWWNALLGNPAGYLPDPGHVAEVRLGLPQREFLPFGPDWLRGWMGLFFGTVIIVGTVIIASLALKFAWRLR